MRADEDFLRYYFDELSYLREAGRSFAQDHPKIAARLEMQYGETSDPHVERLIESFAFLTARLQRQMKAEFPEITTALLSALYPQLVQPLPPMAIACFDVGSTIKGLTDGFPIRRHTSLFAQDRAGLTCKFRTCYDTILWPVTVTEAAFEPPGHHHIQKGAAVLRLRLRSSGDLLRNPVFLPRLRFFLNGTPDLSSKLWEILFANTIDILLADGSSNSQVSLGTKALEKVGFQIDEGVLPYPPNALPGYRLLQEYFNFPRKFLFFDIDGLSSRNCARGNHALSDYLDILFVLDDLPRPEPVIRPRNFCLGCTPIINLFPKTSEPIRLDHTQMEYRLIADINRESTVEIHSILSVSGSANPVGNARTYHPFYSFRQQSRGVEPQAFWLSRRAPAERQDLRGTDVYLSFVDHAFDPAFPGDQTIYAHTLSTNRWLAMQLSDQAQLNIEETTPVLRIACVTKPTSPLYPPLGGGTLWRLVSSLSLNSATLTGDRQGLASLQEILRLYSLSQRAIAEEEIDGILSMETRQIMRRFGPEAWRGFRRGTEFTFTFDPMRYTGGSALLLAAVLRHFLGLYCSVNSFTQVAARRSNVEGEWKRWPALAGEQEMQ